jgi:hypothetical protein
LLSRLLRIDKTLVNTPKNISWNPSYTRFNSQFELFFSLDYKIHRQFSTDFSLNSRTKLILKASSPLFVKELFLATGDNTYSTYEGTALNIAAPGVLVNDSDVDDNHKVTQKHPIAFA